jgi:hypothetical protein
MRPCMSWQSRQRSKRRRAPTATPRCACDTSLLRGACNKSLLDATSHYWKRVETFWPFWAHAATIRSCQQLPQQHPGNSRASRRESLFGADQNVFFNRAAQAEAFEAELLAEPTVRGNKSFFGKKRFWRSAAPAPCRALRKRTRCATRLAA